MDATPPDISRRDALVVLAGAAFGLVGAVAPIDALAAPKTAANKTARRKIHYHLNGGTNPKGQVKTIAKGSTLPVSKLKAPTRTGYSFAGWYRNAKLTKRASTVTGDAAVAKRSVYAKWKARSYSIRFVLNGGSASKLPESYKITSKTISFPAPQRENHVFGGWYSNKTCTKRAESIPAGSTGDRTFYAKWLLYDHWEQHMQAKCKAIKKRCKAAGARGDSFVFVTDMHWPDNFKYSPALIQRVLDDTPVEKVVFGGDILNLKSTRTAAVSQLRSWRRQMDFPQLHVVFGNHDVNNARGATSELTSLTEEEYRLLILKGTASPDWRQLYYHFDNKTAKIRYFVLDSGRALRDTIDDEQVRWLRQGVLELPASWTVVIFVHRVYSGGSADDPDAVLALHPGGKVLVNALDQLYDEARATIAGVFCGHTHRDYSARSVKGYPIIITTCDAGGQRARLYDPVNTERVAGTTSEQCFDVVTVDTVNRRFELTRIGCGMDRSLTY